VDYQIKVLLFYLYCILYLYGGFFSGNINLIYFRWNSSKKWSFDQF